MTSSTSRFRAIGGYATAMIVLGGIAVFVPLITPLVIVASAVFIAGTVVVAAQFLADELGARH